MDSAPVCGTCFWLTSSLKGMLYVKLHVQPYAYVYIVAGLYNEYCFMSALLIHQLLFCSMTSKSLDVSDYKVSRLIPKDTAYVGQQTLLPPPPLQLSSVPPHLPLLPPPLLLPTTSMAATAVITSLLYICYYCRAR